ncbi:MAG: PilZ domain-containing protein [Armatimonadetes bacterium]|nr:PilZ domain-containing protein [Armatimonadota bacterium]
MKEHRAAIRFECQEAVFCYVGERELSGRILDVSREGVRLACAGALEVGSHVEIVPRDRTRGRSPVLCAVRWLRTGAELCEAGLVFLESRHRLARKWVRKLLPPADSQEKRAEVRVAARLPVATADDRELEGMTLDVSRSGACVEMVHPLELGEALDLYVCLPWDLLEIRAEVVRHRRQDASWLHSVRFLQIDGQQTRLLERFLEDSLAVRA